MEYRFDELFKWTSGKPINPEGGNVPVFGSNGIIGYTTISKYNNKIILGRVGAYCGSVEYCDSDFNATDNTLITTCNEELITYGYAFYLLKQFNLNKYAGGAAQPLITQGLLKHLKCDIPNVVYQKKVVDRLKTIDDLIENNTKRIKLLEQMGENLYKEWFVRFRFPGYENAEFENGIPKVWDIKHVAEIGQVVAGGTPSTEINEYYNGDIPWLTPADLSSFNGIYISAGLTYITELGLKKSSAVMMPKNTVLLSSRAPIGYVALARNEICTNQGFKSVVCNEDIVNYQYLYWYFKMNKATLEAFGSGATFLELSSKGLKKVKVIIPPLKLQQQFATIANDIAEQVFQIERANDNLIKQRDLLLPRLMSGKLEVK